MPSHIPKEQFDILHLDLEGQMTLPDFAAADADIGLGDDVVVAGMFIARLGETKNIPIVRLGTIACLPDEPVETKYGFHHAYLIETHSFDGLSGSPVFSGTPFVQMGESKVRFADRIQFRLIGMLLGHNEFRNPRDVIEIQQPNHPSEIDGLETHAIPLNNGIGVVLPMSYILELVNLSELHEGRMEAIERDRKKRGCFGS